MQQSFQLGPGQVIIPALGFRARAVLVDNPGGQWIYVPSALQYVPPYTAQAVIPFPASTTNPTLAALPPPGQQQTGSGQPATVTLTDTPLAYTPGVSYAQSLNPTADLTTDIIIQGTNSVVATTIAATSAVILAAGRYRITAGSAVGFFVSAGGLTEQGFYQGTLFYGALNVAQFGGDFGGACYCQLALPLGGYPLIADGVTAFSILATCQGTAGIGTNTVTLDVLAHVVQETL